MLTQLISNPAGFLLNVVAIVFVFGIVIFVHEFGHFFIAKRSGVKVEQFSFGFGKEIFGFTWGETRYTVNWVPLGGFVKMAGDTPEGYAGPQIEQATTTAGPSDKSREFFAKPWWHRFGIAIAGPFMNYVLAMVIFTGMLLVWGESIQTNPTQVGIVEPHMAADRVGIKPGDEVLSVDGKKMDNFMDIATTIHGRANLPTTLRIKRNGVESDVVVTPEKDEKANRGLIGIRPADAILEHRNVGFFQSVKMAGEQCWGLSRMTIVYLGQQIKERRRPDVAGPVGITQVIVKAVAAGLEYFLGLIATISVAIGLFNLFPVPMLDGGHMLYYLIEGIRGKPVSEKTMGRANQVGFALLMALLVFATFNDFQRILKPSKAAEPAPASSPAK